MKDIAYKRVLLKLSGEALAGERKNGVDAETLGKICDKIKEIVELCKENGIEVTGSVFLKTAEEIKEIVEVCKENGIEVTGRNI